MIMKYSALIYPQWFEWTLNSRCKCKDYSHEYLSNEKILFHQTQDELFSRRVDCSDTAFIIKKHKPHLTDQGLWDAL